MRLAGTSIACADRLLRLALGGVDQVEDAEQRRVDADRPIRSANCREASIPTWERRKANVDGAGRR